MSIKISKVILFSGLIFLLASCAEKTPLEVSRGLLGYIPPPEETTISEELQLEYDRCMKIGRDKNCAQSAYNVVRKVKGLEPSPIPKGYVIILEGDGNGSSTGEDNSKK